MKSLIGLDIGATAVRAIEINHSGSIPVLERLGQVRLPEGACREGNIVQHDLVADAIRQLWDQQGFSTNRVAVGLSSQSVVVRNMAIPHLEPKNRKGALKVHALDNIPIPIDEALLDFQVSGYGQEDGVEVDKGLLVAAQEDYVNNIIDVVERADLEPYAVDLDGFALVRAFASGLAQLSAGEQTDNPNGVGQVIVHIGATMTNVVIVGDGIPRFVRTIMMGGQAVTEAIHYGTDVDLEQAERIKFEPRDPSGQFGSIIQEQIRYFADEVNNSISFYRSSVDAVALTSIVLSGGGALLPGLGEGLEAALNLPVRYGSSLSLLDVSKVNADQSTLSVADPFVPIAVGLTTAGGV